MRCSKANPITQRPFLTAQSPASWWVQYMDCLTASSRTMCTAEKPRQRMGIWNAREATEITNHPNMYQWRKRHLPQLTAVQRSAGPHGADCLWLFIKDEERLLAFFRSQNADGRCCEKPKPQSRVIFLSFTVELMHRRHSYATPRNNKSNKNEKPLIILPMF